MRIITLKHECNVCRDWMHKLKYKPNRDWSWSLITHPCEILFFEQLLSFASSLPISLTVLRAPWEYRGGVVYSFRFIHMYDTKILTQIRRILFINSMNISSFELPISDRIYIYDLSTVTFKWSYHTIHCTILQDFGQYIVRDYSIG